MFALTVLLAWLALGWLAASLWGEWVRERETTTNRKDR